MPRGLYSIGLIFFGAVLSFQVQVWLRSLGWSSSSGGSKRSPGGEKSKDEFIITEGARGKCEEYQLGQPFTTVSAAEAMQFCLMVPQCAFVTRWGPDLRSQEEEASLQSYWSADPKIHAGYTVLCSFSKGVDMQAPNKQWVSASRKGYEPKPLFGFKGSHRCDAEMAKGHTSIGYQAFDAMGVAGSDTDSGKWQTLPRLAIVLSIEAGMFCMYRSLVSALNCYGARHGIPVFVETLQLVRDREYFYSRVAHAMKYLQHYQWVMHIDADTIVLDPSKDLRDLLDDRYHALLNVRENGEVTASAWVVRNSDIGWSFLKRWAGRYTGERRENTDNGDLIQVLIEDMDPAAGQKCDELRVPRNYNNFLLCSLEILNRSRLDWAKFFDPLRGGFLRMFEPLWLAKNSERIPEARLYYGRLFEGDFIGHGKRLHLTLNDDPKQQEVYCTGGPVRLWNDKPWAPAEKRRTAVLALPLKHGFFTNTSTPMLLRDD